MLYSYTFIGFLKKVNTRFYALNNSESKRVLSIQFHRENLSVQG